MDKTTYISSYMLVIISNEAVGVNFNKTGEDLTEFSGLMTGARMTWKRSETVCKCETHGISPLAIHKGEGVRSTLNSYCFHRL